jgi:phosphoenolpyruvate synthase/pyruvate phosphate dikinase
MSLNLNNADYQLTFKVDGLSLLFSDVLIESYNKLHPLFFSLNGAFEQYFTNEDIDRVGQVCLDWLSEKDAFAKYEKNLKELYFHSETRAKELLSSFLSVKAVEEFFALNIDLLQEYVKLDVQATDRAVLMQEINPVIKDNLKQLESFKDVARDLINKFMLTNESYFHLFINRCSEQLNISTDAILSLTMNELLAVIKDKHSYVANTREHFVICYIDKKQYLFDNEAKEFIQHFLQINTTSQVKGLVANKTVDMIEGVVYYIKVDYGNFKEMNNSIAKMKVGEILLSEFTAPELLLACKKAKAIITDMGGLLSHAVLVSRELNIPCIVGTKNATKILKTGDKISLNFNTGEITKL